MSNIFCKECGIGLKNNKSLIIHLRYHHSNISSKIYYDKYLKNISEGVCLTCRKPTKYINLSKGYREFCSVKCMSNNNLIKYKKKDTCIKKYGVEHPLQNENVLNKRKDTCIKKYGVENPFMNKDVLNKIKDTCKKKYGVENPFMNKDVLNKRKETCIKKYGVENPSMNEDVLNKIKDTCIKKYGVENPFMNEDVLNKRKETFIKKYGVEHPLQNKDVLQKIKDTCIKKYGVENPSMNESVKQKIKDTCIKHNLPLVKKVLKSLNIELISEYNHTQKIISLKCLLCNTEFTSSYFNIQRGCGKCPNCFPKYKSIAEQEIINYINNLGIKTINNSRKLIPPYEIDIYIPSKKIGIEYNGLYWHSDNYRYSENCGKDKNYHLNKLNKCLENGVNLIQIFEDEWIIKKDIVKSRLKQILGVNKRSSYNSEIIYARKCIIREIDSKIKNKFLENYHLQGKDNSFIKLGAFFNEELVAVMTFSHGSIAKGSFSKKEGVWELNRFCINSNFHIPGIASKLLSSFKKNYSWKEIFSYADRRWSVGNLYYKLGFSLRYVTKPNYWYVKGINRIHRFSLRKKPEEPKEVPEWLLRFREGYARIWDCGHLKFVLNNN